MFISKKKYEKLENEISDLREELRNCKHTNRFLVLHKKDDVLVDLVQVVEEKKERETIQKVLGLLGGVSVGIKDNSVSCVLGVAYDLLKGLLKTESDRE